MKSTSTSLLILYMNNKLTVSNTYNSVVICLLCTLKSQVENFLLSIQIYILIYIGGCSFSFRHWGLLWVVRTLIACT